MNLNWSQTGIQEKTRPQKGMAMHVFVPAPPPPALNLEPLEPSTPRSTVRCCRTAKTYSFALSRILALINPPPAGLTNYYRGLGTSISFNSHPPSLRAQLFKEPFGRQTTLKASYDRIWLSWLSSPVVSRLPKMGDPQKDKESGSATEVTPNLIGHHLTDGFKTKEATTTTAKGKPLDLPGPDQDRNGGSDSFQTEGPPHAANKQAINSSTDLLVPEIMASASNNESTTSVATITASASSRLGSTSLTSLSNPPSYSGTSSVLMADPSSLNQGDGPSAGHSFYSPHANHDPGVQSETIEHDDANDEEDAQNAVEQAEEGSIIVDSDDVDTDAGYETDTNTAASTSLAESVRDYIYENGRRYHRFREGRYNFPNDDVEQQREDMKHAMVKMLCGQLFFAPIGNNPQQILDIGTGTGIWAIEMGDLFDSGNVLGVDLSPIQPEWVPPNVRFMVDDVESPWLHPRNYFDYIHARHTVMAIKDWPRLMRRAIEHMRPGAWFEIQEVLHFPISHNGTMPADHPVAQYWDLINQGLSRLGIDFHAVSGGRLANRMRECGYVNVSERTLQIPLGTWPKNKVLKTVGLYWRTILLDGIQAIALGPLMRGLGWSREEVELFLIQVRKAYHDNSCLMFMPLHIIYGQKPTSHY